MEFLDHRLLIALAVLAGAYALFRIFAASGKNSRLYEQEIEKIMNSEENKVKGRFED